MEMNKRYGWSKFIVVVPSVAIREGVKKSFDITAEHFQQAYGTKPRSFVYKLVTIARAGEVQLRHRRAGDDHQHPGVQRYGKENRRIYDYLMTSSPPPIDVISTNRPIVIIDEPQKIGAPKALEALSRFNALMVLRYSATHKVEHNKVHRLDALDAYNQKLVKKIAVRGITVKDWRAAQPICTWTELRSLRARNLALGRIGGPNKSGIKRQIKRLDAGTNLHDLSGGIEAYKGLFVTDVDATVT